MAYPSVGEAAARGLERGVTLGRGLREDELRRQEREEERGIRRQQLKSLEEQRQFERKRQERADQTAEEDRQLKALEAEVAAARDAWGGLKASNASEEQMSAASERLVVAGRAAQAARRKRAGPLWAEAVRGSKALLKDFETNRKRPEDVPPSEVFKSLSVALKGPVSDLFQNEDGSPSQLGAAAEQLVEAMRSNDTASMLDAANVVFAPELRVGVGEVTSDGGEIVDKKIVAVNGDPRGNGRVMPTLLVTIRYPDGREIKRHAPITEGRTSGRDDNKVVSLDVGDVLDHVARIQAIERIVNSPEAASYLRQGQAEGQPLAEEAQGWYFASGGKEIKAKEIKTETIDLGDRKLRIKTEPGGRETREELKVGLSPRAELDAETRKAVAELRAAGRAGGGAGGGAPGAEEKRMRIIRNYAKENGISEQEAAKKLRELSVLGVQSPEERATVAAERAEAAAREADVRANVRAAPGRSAVVVRAETELQAKALMDPALKRLPSGWKFGRFVPGKGAPVLDAKGQPIRGPNGHPLWYQ